MNEPLISVIVPVYNSGIHLEKCLDSLVNQTYRNLQIILIDDGSTDGSGELCDSFAERDDRIVCIHQQNGGVSKARNAGLRIACGDYYHFPDSDDYLEPDTYAYLLSCVEEHACDMVNFEYYVTFPAREERHLLADERYGLFGREDAHGLILRWEPFTWNKLYSKKLIAANEDLPGIIFREDIYRGEDTLFAQMAAERADRVWFDKRPLYHYVQSEESACRGAFRVSQLSALNLYEAYETLYYQQYPALLRYFLPGMLHLLISLYYDMWADNQDFQNERKLVESTFIQHYQETLDRAELSRKERIKFALFRLTPTGFCIVHRISLAYRNGSK